MRLIALVERSREILETLYHLRRPSRADLATLAAQQSVQRVSYQDVGATLSAVNPPPAFHRLDVKREIGAGSERFDAAKAAIIDWAGHREAGAIIEPELPKLEVDNVVALALRIWPVWVTATCRIVEVIDEPHRFGFAYGTLPHHPACGEEVFLVTSDPATDKVRLEIVAFSRPSSRLARLGGPLGRVIQRFTAGRYLDGFQNWPSGTRAAEPFERHLTSWRWWFENRHSGGVTIAQFPNWPLLGIGAAAVVRRLSESNPTLYDGAGWLISALWFYWGADELLRGVNPWRKLLGALVVGWRVLLLAGW